MRFALLAILSLSLVGVAVAQNPTDPTASPTQKEKQSKPSTADVETKSDQEEKKDSDQWLLMKALQGTRPGAFLENHRIQIYGWTDLSFTASTAAHSQLPMGFNYRANEFLLQQNWLRIDQPVMTSDTTKPSFGFRSDWILPGSDYLFTLPRGIFNSQLTGSDGRPNRYGIDPIQFYAESYFPNVMSGLDVKVGRTFCQYGVESNDAPSNALFSHAYTFVYDPFTHTGAMATLKLNTSWSVQAGIMMGNDIFIDRASEPYGMGSIKWVGNNERDSVLFSVIVGSGRFNRAENFNNPNIFDLIYTHKFDDRLSYAFEGLFGYQTNVPDIGAANWFGVINYLTFAFTAKASSTTRLEFFNDSQGQRTGFSGLYSVLTTGLSLKPRNDVILRPELRYDYNGSSRPFENRHGLFTAAVDLILRW